MVDMIPEVERLKDLVFSTLCTSLSLGVLWACKSCVVGAFDAVFSFVYQLAAPMFGVTYDSWDDVSSARIATKALNAIGITTAERQFKHDANPDLENSVHHGYYRLPCKSVTVSLLTSLHWYHFVWVSKDARHIHVFTSLDIANLLAALTRSEVGQNEEDKFKELEHALHQKHPVDKFFLLLEHVLLVALALICYVLRWSVWWAIVALLAACISGVYRCFQYEWKAPRCASPSSREAAELVSTETVDASTHYTSGVSSDLEAGQEQGEPSVLPLLPASDTSQMGADEISYSFWLIFNTWPTTASRKVCRRTTPDIKVNGVYAIPFSPVKPFGHAEVASRFSDIDKDAQLIVVPFNPFTEPPVHIWAAEAMQCLERSRVSFILILPPIASMDLALANATSQPRLHTQHSTQFVHGEESFCHFVLCLINGAIPKLAVVVPFDKKDDTFDFAKSTSWKCFSYYLPERCHRLDCC